MSATPDDAGSPGDEAESELAQPDSAKFDGAKSDSPPSAPGAVVREIPIINKRGLHARASAKFVQMVERFNAEISVTRNGETVGGTSIMGLMMLSAGPGTTIVVTATGPEAEAAMTALTELIGSKFGEEIGEE
jgi:phosphocarrier protein HPr